MDLTPLQTTFTFGTSYVSVQLFDLLVPSANVPDINVPGGEQ
jgi:hypothetical protein